MAFTLAPPSHPGLFSFLYASEFRFESFQFGDFAANPLPHRLVFSTIRSAKDWCYPQRVTFTSLFLFTWPDGSTNNLSIYHPPLSLFYIKSDLTCRPFMRMAVNLEPSSSLQAQSTCKAIELMQGHAGFTGCRTDGLARASRLLAFNDSMNQGERV